MHGVERSKTFKKINDNIINNMIKERINLIPPNFSDTNLLGYKAGLRPCRKTGVRLDESIIRGKRIIHNYGHGGGGVSLAPGYANH